MFSSNVQKDTRGRRSPRDDGHSANTLSSVEMLNAFASVGAKSFDLTLTTEPGEKIAFRQALSLRALRIVLENGFDRCTSQRLNLIVRPKPPPVFVQLDDIDAAGRDQLQRASFLSLETSPGNFQVWIALQQVNEEDFARRLRAGVGADPTASGAVRIAGSYNFKPKYAPDYPIVTIAHINTGLLVTESDFHRAGLVPPPSEQNQHPSKLAVRTTDNLRWPSYQRCVSGAPYNRDRTARDISRADFTFALIALDWGWSIEDVTDQLLQKSRKARENGIRYAYLTASRAAEAIARRLTTR